MSSLFSFPVFVGRTTLVAGVALFCVPLVPSVAAATHEIAAAGSAAEGQHGAVHSSPQGYLGIDVREVGDDLVATLKLKEAHGAEIIRVDHDGPAGKMGLRERDVVIQMNGSAIRSEDQLRRMLRDCPPGRAVALQIDRDGQILNVATQMADRAQVEKEAWEQHLGPGSELPGPQAPPSAMPPGEVAATLPPPSAPTPNSRYSKSFLGTLLTSPTYTGATLHLLGPQLGQFFGIAPGAGLLVHSVADNSPAALAGMKAGDVLTKANGQALSSTGDWAKAIREAKGRPVSVTVVRDRVERTITLTADTRRRSSVDLPPDSQTAAALSEL